MSNIIPFGKYKGKHISVLQKDLQYAQWFISSTDIQTKYPAMYRSIRNLLNVDKDLYLKIITYLNENIIKICIKDNIFNQIKNVYNNKINNFINEVNTHYHKGFDVSRVSRPEGYTQQLEHLNITKKDFQKFYKKYKIINLMKICENIRKFGGHECNFNNGYKIAQERSKAQEHYWKNILESTIRSGVIYHPPIQNGCIPDFITHKGVIYEVKLQPHDFIKEQFDKYRDQFSSHTIKYLFCHNAVWDTDSKVLYVQSDLEYPDFCKSTYDLNYYNEQVRYLSYYGFDLHVEEVNDITEYL